MAELNVVLTREPARELVATARDIGGVLADSTGDVQAAILVAFCEAIDQWNGTQQKAEGWIQDVEYFASWPMQCRTIAEAMTDEQCDQLRRKLDSLIEHLEAVPVERRAKRMADKFCDGIAEALA